MQIPWDTYQKAYAEAPQNVQDILNTDAVVVILRNALPVLSQSKEQFVEIIRTFTYYIVKIIDRTQLLQSTKISPQDLVTIEIELKKIIPEFYTESIPNPVPEAPKDLRERLVLRPDAAAVTGPRPAVDMGTGNRPLSREEVLSALSPRRTMTGDIQSIQRQNPPPPPPPPAPQQ